ncbi:MAG: hypothetical protein WCR95_01555 [Eubacteriales bacterium]
MREMNNDQTMYNAREVQSDRETISNKNKKENMVSEIFAGINSSDGYKPLIEGYVKNCDCVYILKGSPGCGKSTLLKRLFAKAVVKNERVTAVKCSSDPQSFDAVVFGDRGIAVADGTKPHVLEPSLPGVREALINLSENLDAEVLLTNKETLERLNSKKSLSYDCAYSFLTAGAKVAETEDLILSDGVDDGKLRVFCERFIKNRLKSQPDFRFSLLPAFCFCGQGFVFLPIGSKPVTYGVKDFCGLSELLLSQLCFQALERGINTAIVPSPVNINKISGLFFIRDNILVLSERYMESASEKKINPLRFVYPEFLKQNRSKLKFLKKFTKNCWVRRGNSSPTRGPATRVLKIYILSPMILRKPTRPPIF